MLFLKIYVTFVRREQKRMNKRENNMKRFLYLTVCLLILGEFYGCNGDVFVDDFRPSDSELALDERGCCHYSICSCQLGLVSNVYSF